RRHTTSKRDWSSDVCSSDLLRAMATAVRPGVTTAELCEIGSGVLSAHGARSSPPMVYGFPSEVCISVNDEVVHGIPGERALQPRSEERRVGKVGRAVGGPSR